MRTSCCLGLHPPTSNQASLIPIKPPQLPLVKNQGCWRRQCVVVGVASFCTVIGLEMCNPVTLAHEAVAQEKIMFTTMSTDEEVANNLSLISVGSAKWSEKRACPSWRGNSLETIVPENLPRPAARRRYEAVGSTSKTAPSLSSSVKHQTNGGGSCFYM
ncbi:hypothetical protein SESBI_21529 [Sesbania bispinosa]|nr:hypothetical protein SESBI_21529 [Sesbania bispinosa]